MNNESIAIEAFIGFCDSNEIEDQSNAMRAFESYNNYFDILDGAFESFDVSDNGLSIALEGFDMKNIFSKIKTAIEAAWNWFITKIREIKEKIFGKSKKKLRAENEDLRKQTSGLQYENEDLKNEKKKNEERIEELADQIYVLEIKLKNSSANNAFWKDEVKRLYDAQDRADVVIEKMEDELNLLRKEKEKLEEATKKLSEKKDIFENKYKSEKAENLEKLSRTLNTISFHFRELKNLYSDKLKICKYVIDDIADGVKPEDIKDLKQVRSGWINTNKDNMKGKQHLDIIEKSLKEFKEKTKYMESYTLMAYVEKISKGIDSLVAETKQLKDEFYKTVNAIEQKRISGNINTINGILSTLQKDYVAIQNIAVKISNSLIIEPPLNYRRFTNYQ